MSTNQKGHLAAFNDPPRRGRPRKFPLETVRERMIEASLELLLESGIAPRLDSVRVDRALLDADVPRGSAYTAWTHDDRSPQENLQHSVMLRVLAATTGNAADPTRDFTLALIADLAPLINSTELAERRKARTEIVRQVAKFNHDRLNSDMWKLYRALALTISTQQNPDPELVAAIEAGEERLISVYTDLFAEFAEIVRLEPRPGTSIRAFAIAMTALNDGLANHQTPAFDYSEPMVVGEAEWSLYAYCVEALFEAFFDFSA